MVGAALLVGSEVGFAVKAISGLTDGAALGDGLLDGAGLLDGESVGSTDGATLGAGLSEGAALGLGLIVGESLGDAEGESVLQKAATLWSSSHMVDLIHLNWALVREYTPG